MDFAPDMLVEFSNADNSRRIRARVVAVVSAQQVNVSEIKTGRPRAVDPVATNMRPLTAANLE